MRPAPQAQYSERHQRERVTLPPIKLLMGGEPAIQLQMWISIRTRVGAACIVPTTLHTSSTAVIANYIVLRSRFVAVICQVPYCNQG